MMFYWVLTIDMDDTLGLYNEIYESPLVFPRDGTCYVVATFMNGASTSQFTSTLICSVF